MMTRFYYKKLTIVFILILSLYFTLKYLKTQNASQEIQKLDYKEVQVISIDNEGPTSGVNKFYQNLKNPALSTLISFEKCPLCFGTELCVEITNAQLTGEMSHPKVVPTKPYKIIEEGTWKTKEPVIVKTLKQDTFSALEDFICKNTSQSTGCNAAQSIKDSYIFSANTFSQDSVRNIYKVAKHKKNDIPISICATDKLINLLKKTFDENEDDILNLDEKTMLFTTFSINPEALVLKFLNKANLNLPFPKYYGACGRITITEGGLVPLKDFLKEPIEVRVSLANQILQMVDDFLEDDPEWVLLFTDFSYDNLAVNKDGEVVIVDVEDMVILDRSSIQSEYSDIQQESPGDPCNVKCFQQLTEMVLSSGQQSPKKDQDNSGANVCPQLFKASHLMYAIVCQRILSFLDEHRVEDYFSTHPNKVFAKSEYPGLLHSPPEHDHTTLEELLKECVQETAEGGRLQAAEELREYLNEIAAGETEKKLNRGLKKEIDEGANELVDYLQHENEREV